jgi:HPt (histidine-containing phosphotransfer) domain-containing protein
VVEQEGDGGAGTASERPATFDENALRQRLSGDDQLMAQVIRLFLTDLPVRLAEIEGAVTRRDAEAVRTAAHALKGAAASLSVGGLFERASALEELGAGAQLDGAEGVWRQVAFEASRASAALRRCSLSAKTSL